MGDGIRRIASALYERAGEEEKEEVTKFCKKLGLKGNNGKVSVREFKKDIRSGVLNFKKEVFNGLDWNRDGWVDLEDVLVLFYYSVKSAITILRCGGCRQLLFGPSYSCFDCLSKSADQRFALCCDCYWESKLEHPHPLSSTSAEADDMLQDQALLFVKVSDMIMSTHPGSLPMRDMKKLWEDAKSDNGASVSRKVETMADHFFESADENNAFDREKFSKLMKKEEESELEAFLKTREDSDFATNFMKDELRRVLTQSNSPPTSPTTAVVAHNAATTSTPSTHFAHPSTSSKAISPLKVATTTFKLLEMALTIANLSSMCTIL